MISYLNPEFLKLIDQNSIKTILELGARGGDEAVELANYYKAATVHTVECNPYILSRARNTVKDSPKIKLHEIAVSDIEEEVNFYPINDANPGASSFLKPIPGTLGNDCRLLEPITIKTIRLDEYLKQNQITDVDMICADIQGYELKAFTGMGEYFNKVKYVISEMPIANETYFNAPNKDIFLQFMAKNNFVPKVAIRENVFEINVLFQRNG